MLKVENIRTAYGKIEALFGVSMAIDDGELVALIGANGAGKSTTLKTILGLTPPGSGRITFMGRRIDGLSPRANGRLGIALCPEGRRLWPEMTVRENLELGALLRKDKGRVARDLEQMYDYFPVLGQRRNQMAGSLSGGEQQMAAMARALMARPRLLMLDEPSLGLSPILVEKMSEIISGIHQDGTTVLLVEQNAYLALTMSTRAYVLEVGLITVSGKSTDLLQNDYVRAAYLGKRRSKLPERGK
jgi:branched-chain amino acid transport system ATP-binding protein